MQRNNPLKPVFYSLGKLVICSTLFIFMFSFCLKDSGSEISFSKGDSILKTGWYYVSETQTEFIRQLDKDSVSFYLEPAVIVTVDQFKKFEFKEREFKGTKYTELIIWFDSIGTQNWSIATEKAVGNRLALIVNDKLVMAPKVNSQIVVGVCVISRPVYSHSEIEELLNIIKSEQK